MPAKEPLAWKGVRSVMTYGPTCPTHDAPVFTDEFEFPFNRSRGYYVNEDCLNLNIWSKKQNDTKKRPVMVWLHGGGFSSGSSVEFPSYDGENLSRKEDVVVVSINHRLNIIGFLDLSAYGDKYPHAANAGIMDIVLALTWVKENIANFGGDPGNVTIFGQSGGGAKVMCLLNMPSAKGLFHKAIIQSGSYLTRFIEPDVSKKVAAETLHELGLEPDQVEALETLPYERLDAAGRKAIEKVAKTLNPGERAGFGLEWEPVHDGDLLPYQPGDPSAIRLSENIPLLVGSCKNEYMPFIPGSREISMDSARIKLEAKYGNRTADYLAAVKKAYPHTVEPSDFIDIDLLFRPLVIAAADQKAMTGSAPVFVYLFAWQSPVLDGAYKAYHCMDLPFVFNNISRCEEMTGGGQSAYLLADKVSAAWAAFARNGNPNHKGLPEWPAYTVKDGATMVLDNECQAKDHFDRELLGSAR
jgi:para-nitrobenzyl esterase